MMASLSYREHLVDGACDNARNVNFFEERAVNGNVLPFTDAGMPASVGGSKNQRKQLGNNDASSSGQGISSELRARDLPSKRLLGKGLASVVYETEWNGERFARKDFIGVPSGAFQKEAAVLVGLKDHENVVKTHGRTVDKMSCSLVLEYMEEDLLDLLLKRKESHGGASGAASGSRCEGNPFYPFELAEALAILSQIARGMEFLHEQNIPHGDLKTKNILVSHIYDGDKNMLSVKVADFGLVRTKSKSMSFVSRQARKLDVVQWKAPEVVERLLSEDNDVTSSESDSNSDTESTGSLGVSDSLSADVYSFAVTCSQILTGEGPYPNGNWKELGPKIVSGELRPNLPAACPGLLKSLLESCWTKSLAQRPTFSFIQELLGWLVDPEVPGHLSLNEVREKIKFLDNPPPLAEKRKLIIQPRRRAGFKKLTIEIRPPRFKKALWFGTYEPEDIDRAKDAINYYMGSNQPYHYSDSPLIFAGIPLKGILFKDLQPSCEQFIRVGDKEMRASAFFAREVKAAIRSVTGKRKKFASLERKYPFGPPRETSPSLSYGNISSITEEIDSTGEVELVSMNAFPDELLKSVFRRLELFDTLRARAVCKRWLAILTPPLEYSTQFRDLSSSTVQSWCPLVFMRTGEKHDWCGYDSTSSTWQPLPSLVDLPEVDIRPLTGNGKALIGYKIMTAFSQVVVGDPLSSTWQTIPSCTAAWGAVGHILLVDPEDSASFQIVAVQQFATEIFNSALGVWTKLRNEPPPGVHESTVLFTRDKLISATLCGGLLFCYGLHPGNASAILVSFDVQKKQWTNDCIALPPHATSKCFQMVECAGNLFAAIEDPANSTVAIWGLGLLCREFVGPMVEMPQELYIQMCMTKRRSHLQLKAVGHQHRMFFWRNIKNPQALCIVVFDFLLRTWAVLPEFAQGIGHFQLDSPLDLQTWVDTGSFEARNLKETNLL